MKKLLSQSLRVTKWLMYAVASLFLITLACWIFLPDEDINPAAQKILMQQPQKPPSNAYYALLGIAASAELDAYRVGVQIANDYESIVQKEGYWAKFEIEKYLGDKPSKAVSPCDRACISENYKLPMLTKFKNDQFKIKEQLTEQAPFLARYRALRSFENFEEILTPNILTPMPQWSTVSALSGLENTAIAYAMEQPSQQAAALEILLNEITFWKKISLNTDSLITKMVAAEQLRSKYQLAYELLAFYPISISTHQEVIQKITTPLDSKYSGMKSLFENEFRINALLFQNILQETREPSSISDSVAYWASNKLRQLQMRTNASINRSNEQFSQNADFYSQHAYAINAGQAAFDMLAKEFDLFDPRNWIYNPIGKILVEVARPSYSEYSYRLHDLAAYSRLLELQRQIVVKRIATAEIPAFLANVGEDLQNPYTRQPMLYDAAAHSISMKPQSRFNNKNGLQTIYLANTLPTIAR